MGFLIWLLFGLIVGWIANSIMDVGRRGLIKNIVIGLIGSFVGGWLGHLIFGISGVGAFTISGFVSAILGAIVFIWFLRLLKV